MTDTTASPAASESRHPSLLKTVGWAYFPIAFIGRVPFAMTVVGVLTLVATVRGSYAEAGLTSAFVGIGTAIFGPFLGALADRIGQRPVLLAAAVVNAAALLVIAVIAYSDLALPWVLVSAFAIGASSPQLSPMSRSRLVGILMRTRAPEHRARSISGTMSYESMADELVFVFGPVLVGLLAFTLGPWSPIVGAALLTLVFVGGFALHPTARVLRADGDPVVVRSPGSQLFRPGILVLVAGMIAIGFFFGSALTSLTAFMGVHAEASQAGIVYGAMGIGSAVFALGIVLLPTSFSFQARWMLFAIIALGGALALPFIETVPFMAVVLLVTGIGIGPSLVTLFSLASVRAPVGRSTTVMTMLNGGIILGQSAASAITGVVAEEQGYSASFSIVAGATAALAVLGILNWVIASREVRRGDTIEA